MVRGSRGGASLTHGRGLLFLVFVCCFALLFVSASFAKAETIGSIPIGRPFKETVGSAAGCVICQEVIRHVLYQIQLYMDVKERKYLTTYEVEDFMEVICDPYSTEGAWIRQLGFFLVLDEEGEGHIGGSNADNSNLPTSHEEKGGSGHIQVQEDAHSGQGGKHLSSSAPQKREGEGNVVDVLEEKTNKKTQLSSPDDEKREEEREVKKALGSPKVRFEVYGLNQFTKCKRTCATIQEKCEFITTYSYFDSFSKTVSQLSSLGKLATAENVERLQEEFCSKYMVCFMKENLQLNINQELNNPSSSIRSEIEKDDLEVIERREYIREFTPMDNMPHRITENYTEEERQKLRDIVQKQRQQQEEAMENSGCDEDNHATNENVKEDL